MKFIFPNSKHIISIVVFVSSIVWLICILCNRQKEADTFAVMKVDKRRDVKYVLFWTKFWDFTMYHGAMDFSTCPVKDCYATNNKSLLPIDKFDALMFHSPQFCKQHERPKQRSAHQRYIYAATETSPQMCSHESFDHYFNWTMTFRLNSDLLWPYGRVINTISKKVIWPLRKEKWIVASTAKDDGGNIETYSAFLERFQAKTKMVAWLVSHCKTTSHREDKAKELQKYVAVDIYGRCGTLKCSVPYKQHFECLSELAAEYKFYLSFENSICNYYVSEKFFNALRMDMVPVVYGGADYSKIAPPGSYIDVRDFKDMKELSEYLIHLSQTPEEYFEYFWWKKFYTVESNNWTGSMPYCDLCNMLHNNHKTSIYEDIAEFDGSKDIACNPYRKLSNN